MTFDIGLTLFVMPSSAARSLERCALSGIANKVSPISWSFWNLPVNILYIWQLDCSRPTLSTDGKSCYTYGNVYNIVNAYSLYMQHVFTSLILSDLTRTSEPSDTWEDTWQKVDSDGAKYQWWAKYFLKVFWKFKIKYSWKSILKIHNKILFWKYFLQNTSSK